MRASARIDTLRSAGFPVVHAQYAVVVNRKLKDFRVYGPFTSATEAWAVQRRLKIRTWVKSTNVITMDAVKMEGDALIEIAEI